MLERHKKSGEARASTGLAQVREAPKSEFTYNEATVEEDGQMLCPDALTGIVKCRHTLEANQYESPVFTP